SRALEQASSPEEQLNEGDRIIRRAGVPISEAGPAQITNENYPDLIESFDYPNADIADVIRAISKLTGKRFIVESSVRGNITIIAPTQSTLAEDWQAFLSALPTHGFQLVPIGKLLTSRHARSARRPSI